MVKLKLPFLGGWTMRNIFLVVAFFGLVCATTQGLAQQPPPAAASPAAQPSTSPAPAAVQPVPAKPAAEEGNPTAPPDDLASKWKSLAPTQKQASIGGALGIFLVAIAILVLGGRTDILRDRGPQDFAGVRDLKGNPLRRAFSLSQSQMAWWFFLVLAAYLYLFIMTGDINTISTQALTLMGIGTGTALGSAMINSLNPYPALTAFQNAVTKLAAAKAANPQVAADVAAAQATVDSTARNLASEGFFTDILTDAAGISLHRFQSFVWTLVLGVVFIVEVAVRQSMPEFDTTMLALLGISAGAYLGFRVPEQTA
jgi:hypothetical protein